mmetsp:Transcript_20405/g.38344  ORF Transcript_20405/g.38344 Transcript_20405/m.38344 type:complete len:164 (-) Transcript_20405:166-657(-)|eukprot:CAMPEP_0197449106 /NCGR_PEP_ID=MMETSP1175-20131217/20143_1 /TAXON_ID=1003142 /ORGANISM="Triceratium dubium, Strain CCMP147" /LENGTH=163 /DNA_ID=CAMNT_0042981115 /DNA_START=128 /DNA_END=619 /DNA_ORIENTATION=-
MLRSVAIAALIALSASCANAFTVGHASQPMTSPSSTALFRGLMSPEELDGLMTNGRECEEGECSIDDVDDLIGELLEQQKLLYNRVQELKDMIKGLEALNADDSRNVDEVKETVRAIVRIFQMGAAASGNDYPALSRPTGYSGEVGDGPKTAYDVLSPKPYKE